MPRKTLLLLLALASVRSVLGQPLVCPPSSSTSGRPCDTFHYHVQMYRPDTKGFAEFFGINQFASQSSCEQAREARTKQNLAIVDYMKKVKNNLQYEPDRAGSCHCDMTVERASPNFLTDAQRATQIRMAEEVRKRVRERLLDAHVPSDSDLIRGLSPLPPVNPVLNGPRLAPLQATASASTTNAPEDLRATRTVQNTPLATSSFELPLAPIAVAGMPVSTGSPEVPAPTAEATGGAGAATTAATGTQTSGGAPATAAATDDAADDSADAFISAETERIQAVLKESSAVTDDATRTKILEACMQRIQLLSNLRTLIQGSGTHSRLATAARAARDESNRLALATKLFGSDMAAHWAPKEPASVVLDPQPAVESKPEAVLRDSSNQFSESQKKRALYLFLGRTHTTEEQQLWLIPVVDRFLE